MTDIVIYTTPKILKEKKGRGDWCLEGFYWELKNFPKHLKVEDRIYFAVKGFIRGSFELDYVNKRWRKVQWYSNTWRKLKKKIPCKPFQGFKYKENK